MSEEILDFEIKQTSKTVSVWKNGLAFGLLALLAFAIHWFVSYYMPLAVTPESISTFRTIQIIRNIVVPILYYGILASGMIRLAIRNHPSPYLLKQVAITSFVAFQTSWITAMIGSFLLGGIGISFSFDNIPQILSVNVLLFIAAIPISRIPLLINKQKSK